MLALPKNIRIMPSHSFDVNAGIAQLVEHDLAKVGVASSSLVSRSKFSHECPAGIAQLVEHDLAKVGVASSSLVSRSKFTIPRKCGGFFYGLIFPRFPFSSEKGNVFLCFLNLT